MLRRILGEGTFGRPYSSILVESLGYVREHFGIKNAGKT
jgi:hypothetical protein